MLAQIDINGREIEKTRAVITLFEEFTLSPVIPFLSFSFFLFLFCFDVHNKVFVFYCSNVKYTNGSIG